MGARTHIPVSAVGDEVGRGRRARRVAHPRDLSLRVWQTQHGSLTMPTRTIPVRDRTGQGANAQRQDHAMNQTWRSSLYVPLKLTA